MVGADGAKLTRYVSASDDVADAHEKSLAPSFGKPITQRRAQRESALKILLRLVEDSG